MLNLDNIDKTISILCGAATVLVFVFRKILVPYCKKFITNIKNWFAILKRLDQIDQLIKKSENSIIVTDFLSKLLLDDYEIGIFICDKTGNVIWTNESLQRMFGAHPSEMLNDSWASFLHPDDITKTFKSWRETVGDWSPYRVRYRVIKEKEFINCEATADLIKNSYGDIVGYIGQVVII